MRSSLPALVLAGILVVSAVGAGLVAVTGGFDPAPDDPSPDDPGSNVGDGSVTQFESAAAFTAYVQAAQDRGGYGGFLGGVAVAEPGVEFTTDSASSGAAEGGDGAAGQAGSASATDGASRVSGTNVQETGIDEPDRVKTAPDGSAIYYADGRGYWGEGGQTRVLDTSDPAAPAVVENIDASGKLLLSGDTLVVFDQRGIYAYDVSDSANPERTWSRTLNASVRSARLVDGRLYLVLQKGVRPDHPCPVEPFGDGPGIACTDVYHPTSQTDATVTYTTAVLSPESGETLDSVTVLGTYGHSATYVSENAVYLTYTKRVSHAETFEGYLESSDLLDQQAESRLDELATYDLSSRARQVELQALVQNWLARQPAEERQELQQQFQEGYQQYVEDRKRQLLRSGIVKIAIGDDGDSLSVAETGEVPGRPLNQWALDEHDGELRIATTVDPWGATSTNDLYTLDSSLSIQGSVEDMGVTERIYSVRFMGDTAYVVTFRQIDPFYVVDLSDSANPEVKGEVKLPGFSRYLHPIGEDRMLGIGQEDGQVKATVFDVSDPQNPTVAESKILDARWSAIAQTHHAFLHDPKHDVFFLPTERGGYVFGEDLSQKTFVQTDTPATRAVYLDDYLYVFSESELVVVDENSWETVAEVVLGVDGGEEREEKPIPTEPEDYQREKNVHMASLASGASGAV
ncbi:beta-propeller domain-containing protein [Haloarchaeobius sp. HME9146]|uniref:beta-propeller domain-containing protein n=1 Tax=Haloarchaeobius sp. HME9146 TaxID=2978732 RepID=UPI0021C14CCD|nr:beta-propeller domain-containing protein [Haloarchaeobius sp. HME9146]MCT9095221.1 beta-propeller domain-containing protein [Haloarchaeobius sp. HME9146]